MSGLPKSPGERKPVAYIKWNQQWQILPGITIIEMSADDKLARYVSMGKFTNAPAMWMDENGDFLVETKPDQIDVFPRASVFRYRLA